MTSRLLSPSDTGSAFAILEISEFSGLNTRDKGMSRTPDEASSLKNIILKGRGFEKRAGSAVFGAAQTGSKVVGLGALTQDSGVTPLMMVNQTLFKYVSSAWAAGDKTNYTANLDTSIVTMTTKSGSSLDSGTTSSGTTPYLIEDSSKSWTPGQHIGRCVLILGEVKLITDNTSTILFLGDKLNGDTASVYQTIAYSIFAVAPFAFIANGTDAVQKYNLTTTTPIDGTHVSGGKALPLFKFLSTHQGRMVGSTGTGDKNDRVFFTDQGIGENMTVDTNLNINLNFFNDGDEVSAHGSLPLANGSALLVTKTRSVHAVEGTNILNYASRPVFSSVGCIAPKTFKILGTNAFFLSHLGVMSIGNSEAQRGVLDDPLPISLPIQEEIDALTTAQKTNACAQFFGNRYYIQIGSRCWYYDLEQSLRQQRHVWLNGTFPYGFNIFAEIDGAFYGGNQLSGQAYTILTGTQDGSTNVTMQWESSDISIPGMPSVWVENVEITAEESASTMLRLQIATDGGSYGSIIGHALDNESRVYVFPIRKYCKNFRLRLTETGSETPVRIHLPIRVYYGSSEYGESGSKDSSLTPA